MTMKRKTRLGDACNTMAVVAFVDAGLPWPTKTDASRLSMEIQSAIEAWDGWDAIRAREARKK